MKVITVRSLILEVSKRWDGQYPPRTAAPDKVAIGHRLRVLDLERVSAEQIDNIIGNSSWTRVPECDDCGTGDLGVVVQVGQPPDYESATAHLCLPCLRAAVEMAERAAKGEGANAHNDR